MQEPKTQFSQFPQIGPAGPEPSVPAGVKAALIKKIVIGVVVVAVAGTGVALGTRIWDPLWNPFRPEPEEVLEEMFDNMAKVKSCHSEITIDVAVIEGGEEVFTTSMLFSGDLDAIDPENSKLITDFDIVAKGEGLEENFSLTGEMRIIGETSYLKMNKIIISPEMELFVTMFGIDLDEIKGEWVKIKEGELEDWMGGTYSYTGQPEELSEKEQEELTEKIKNLFTESKIYYVKEELPDEKIDGKKMYHYLLALDNEEFIKLIEDIFRVSTEAPGETGGLGGAFLVEGITESLNEFFDEVGELTADFWIGKKDLLLYKVELEKEIDVGVLGEESKGKIIISFAIEFSDFGRPVTIEPPANYKNLEDVLAGPEGFMALFVESQQQGTEARLLSDMSQLRTVAEIIHANENSYENFSCQNEQAKPVCDDIELYAGTEPIIRSSKDKHCAYLISPTGTGYLCIDSTGNLLKTTTNPGGKGYCDGKTFVCQSQ